ncbi:MAG: tryptophan synthase subunit alpha [Alphaproteobacteria bacterium]|nr:tryptophan synthase subunit alpha [Alphaproteobacteria bacterium]
MNRIETCFSQLKQQGRPGLITFTMAGDPSFDVSLEIIKTLAKAGSDMIEIGMPFSDPAADGPTIQLAGQRALKQGINLHHVLNLVSAFRSENATTPLILMGYYNPILSYGVEPFVRDAAAAGADGFIVVDVPPEEDHELFNACREYGLHLIKLVTPTTDEKRLEVILPHAGGFLYYVSIAGITGTKIASTESIERAVQHFKHHTTLPVAVGFGIKGPHQALALKNAADAVVVGSALVAFIEQNLASPQKAIQPIEELVQSIAAALA